MTEKLVYDGLQSCPYLPGQVARMPLFRQLAPLSLDTTDRRLANSERRVGTCLYRTACPTCRACEGIRIPVHGFRPSKSQRRVRNRWGDAARVEIGPVSFDDEKLRMFNRHKRERGLTDEEGDPMEPAGYIGWLVNSCMLTVEMRYYFEDVLVGVGVLDLGRNSASSVYFYFDPDRNDLSPGTFSALEEIAFCQRTGREFLYLGLYVEQCRHLSYKDNFRPNERLIDGDWRPT